MCHILKTQFILCSHYEKELKRCQASMDNANQNIKKPMTKGWFKSLISSFSTPAGECDRGTVRVRKVAHCSSCTAKNEIARREQGGKWCIRYDVENVTSKTYRRARSRERVSLEEQFRRSDFQCSMCVYEGRTVRPVQRNFTINGGLCCSRGLDEYVSRHEAEEKHGKSLLVENDKSPVTNSAAVPRTLRRRDPVRRGKISRQKTTSDDGKARRRFSWEAQEPHHVREETHCIRQEPRHGKESHHVREEPRDIRPEAAKDFSSFVSETGYLLPSEKFPSPMHKEPGIDWERWDRAPQTHYGRYPPPDVPPGKPLPDPPLSHKARDIGSVGRDGGTVGSVQEQRRQLSVSCQKPLPPLPLRLNADKNNRNSRDIVDQACPGPLAFTRDSVKALRQNREGRDGDESQDIAAQSRSQLQSAGSRISTLKVSPATPLTSTFSDLPPQPRKSILSRLDDSIDETMQYWAEK